MNEMKRKKYYYDSDVIIHRYIKIEHDLRRTEILDIRASEEYFLEFIDFLMDKEFKITKLVQGIGKCFLHFI